MKSADWIAVALIAATVGFFPLVVVNSDPLGLRIFIYLLVAIPISIVAFLAILLKQRRAGAPAEGKVLRVIKASLAVVLSLVAVVCLATLTWIWGSEIS